MERIICLVIGYVFGLFQTAYIYGKLHGIDIRNYGSGNAGTTNTLRVLGTKAGLIVLFVDILKCILAIVVTGLLFGKNHPETIYLLKLYAAMGAILGHNFSFLPSLFCSYGRDFVLWRFFSDTLCIAWFSARLCGIHHRNGSARTNGDFRHESGAFE